TAARVNQAPSVNAGPDQTVELPATASLAGTATDDGLPSGSHITYAWSVVAAPAGASASLATASAASTTATFSAPGDYMLRLTASDSLLSGFDDLAVTVEPANAAPVANAGADQSVELPATASLAGSVTDDGRPVPVHLTSSWSKISGPGTVTFANGSNPMTTASFSVGGLYVLRLTGSDGKRTGSD